ncbi:MAG: hypothetical protein E6G94_15260 [Alphaproteobacteria bacterium]|nr:MAG: hypothetical protein E6G94_15260 [Alphaproteobacteria bacterium]
MPARAKKPTSVTLGPPGDKETPEFQALLKAKVKAALDNPRPPIPAAEAFARLDEYIAAYKLSRTNEPA